MKNFTGNILILTHWSFHDALIQTYTLPYLNIIRRILPADKKIILVTSEQSHHAISEAELEEVNNNWKKQNMRLITLPYQPMGVGKVISSLKHIRNLYQCIKKDKISTIHSFCTPAGSIGYMLSKLTGARLIIDSYEPHAESMVENGTWKSNGYAFKTLFLFEKWQTLRASHFIATSGGMKSYAKETYGVDVNNFFVKPACVDLNAFVFTEKDQDVIYALGLKDKIVCVYAGKLGGIYLKEEVFDFLKECYNYWGDRFRFLMLTNAPHQEVVKEMERVGLPDQAVIQKFVKHEDVSKHLSVGDFAINPVRPVLSKRYCTSIKDGEYWAMGLPVVITKNISDDSAIISRNNIGYELKELTIEEYRKAIKKIEELISDTSGGTRKKIRGIAEQYRSYQIAEKIYTEIYQ